MGACCSNSNSKIDLSEYNGFHDGNPPNSTNDYDSKWVGVEGQLATFSLGPFQKPQAIFSLEPGVIRTRVGYSGGKTKIKHFVDTSGVADHTACLDIEFDPNKTSYKQLLDIFWKIHDPTDKNDRIYFTKVFYHNKEQKHAAEYSLIDKDRNVTKNTIVDLAKNHVRTDIEPAKYIFLAKEEEQHSFLQKDNFLKGIVNCTKPNEYVYSHLATKLNGLVSGYATLEQLDAIAEDLGLQPEVVEYLQKKIESSSPVTVPPPPQLE